MQSKDWHFECAMTVTITWLLLTSVGLSQPQNSQGAYGRVIRIDRDAFKPDAGQITFEELPLGKQNPIYGPTKYGADPNGITVTFGGFFVGQRRGSAATCQGGGVITGCVIGKPDGPLALDPSSPPTRIVWGGTARRQVLSGSPTFNGPISMLFDRNIAGVGLQGGYFDAPRSTAILAFDRQGGQVGGVVNLSLGYEYMALVTQDGSETIAGLQFSLVGPEPAGFAIDNLSFAPRSQLQRSAKPLGGGSSIGELFRNATDRTNTPAQAPTKSLRELFR